MKDYTEKYVRSILYNHLSIKEQGMVNDSYIALIDIENALEDLFLTDNEIQVSEYMKLGYKDKEIAPLLNMTRQGVCKIRRELESVITDYLNV